MKTMPEGDTIRGVANRLAPLVGQTIERATTRGLVRAIAGRTVTAVDAHGKHLYIDLDDRTQIHVHQGMNGRFRARDRREGDALLARMSPGKASLAIVTATHVFLWITCPTVEIVPRRAPNRGMHEQRLGPDVLAGGFDPMVAATRAAEHPARTIGEVLLDQRVAAGIGNIWKTESCFACRIDPRTFVRDIPSHVMVQIYEAARERMAASVEGARDFAAYSRTGKPCPRCATPIAAFQLGDPPRWTWACPHCQATAHK
ncbi:MAG TPA: DNA-formamidopyrimidine glycosylase family protein [Kofleriaceae bacterium]|nr:DNA-formamidopyrimidine glycosylase family protein [Kofleriaceae bacterium]